MTAAIYYHPDGYTVAGPKLMGRHAAGESFLRGFLRYATCPEFWVLADNSARGREFAGAVRAAGRSEPVKLLQPPAIGQLVQPGAVHYPDSHIADRAWQRAWFGHRQWSITGITHTIANLETMAAISHLLSAPIEPWDALICTSAAVKDSVQRILLAHEEHLRARLAIGRVVLPQRPIIPLGIHAAEFAFTAEQREAARRQFAADDQTIIVLFLGRLSFHAKAHPLAMYQALERAASTVPADTQVMLVECGWHGNQAITQAFMQAALTACPSVQVVTLDGRKAESRALAWASADVFCSLSDNFQETFGIAPVEAMAAGLPVVVSDWNGYRDTVREGVDGFRIPTLMPEPGSGADLAAAHVLGLASYDRYCGYTAMTVAVDVEAAAAAFERLFASRELRHAMGEAGRRRAQETYDWSRIIPRYEALWDELAERRNAEAGASQADALSWPPRLDPYTVFAAYPTLTFSEETHLALVDPDAESAIARTARYRGLGMVGFAAPVLPSDEELQLMLKACEYDAATAAALIGHIPPERRRIALRGLAWLVKMGVLKTL